MFVPPTLRGLAAVCGLVLASCASNGGRQASTAVECRQSPEQDLLRLVNIQRQEHGLAPLQVDMRLVLAARSHADDIAKSGRIGHVGQNGSQPVDRVEREGYPWMLVGETVAAGQLQAVEVVEGWLESPPHRRDLLEPRFAAAGIALVTSRTARYEALWVMVFGAAVRDFPDQLSRCHPAGSAS